MISAVAVTILFIVFFWATLEIDHIITKKYTQSQISWQRFLIFESSLWLVFGAGAMMLLTSF